MAEMDTRQRRRRRRLTDAERALIRALAADGVPWMTIAAEIGRSYTTIYWVLHPEAMERRNAARSARRRVRGPDGATKLVRRRNLQP